MPPPGLACGASTTGVLGALHPSASPDGRTLAVTMREAAIEIVALGTGSTGGNSNPLTGKGASSPGAARHPADATAHHGGRAR